ncbi:MAG TPA: hypothetical protein DD435_08015 [Cyanobacteria bacterium UBA8530]|nr:hypothetical protein [Cyanobacteria bacterium UBA8530]
MRACQALWQHFEEVAYPPGSEWCLGIIIALAGWEVGLNSPYDISDVLLIGNTLRNLWGGENPVMAFRALSQGLFDGPIPSLPAVASSLTLLAILVLSLGGWIMAAFRVAADCPVEEKTWQSGVFGNFRLVGYFLSTSFLLLFLSFSGGALGAFLLKTAFERHPLSGLYGMGGLFVLVFTAGLVLYGAATATMGGFVAIAETKTPFLQLYPRGRRIFLKADGWDTFGSLAMLALLWAFLKTALSYFLLPLPVAVAIARGLGILGDGIFLLLTLLAAATLYQEGARK